MAVMDNGFVKNLKQNNGVCHTVVILYKCSFNIHLIFRCETYNSVFYKFKRKIIFDYYTCIYIYILATLSIFTEFASIIIIVISNITWIK